MDDGTISSNEATDQFRAMIATGAASPLIVFDVAACGGLHAYQALEVAREAGCRDFDWMLEVAAGTRRDDICYLAVLWGATNAEGIIGQITGEPFSEGTIRAIRAGQHAARL